MIAFDFHCRTRIVFGPGKIAELGALAREIGARRALVVSDPGVLQAGHTQRAIDSLHAADIETHLFMGVHENPTTDDVAAGVEVARQLQPEILIPIGGGSAMDCAKGVNFIYTNGGRMQDYWGAGKATQPMLPMIAAPTTSGTGSEAQSYALISDAETHVKMACGDKKASFRVAILDPELTLTQPPRVTALTGIDALSHALETYVTKARNSISLSFSREAWRLLAGNFARVLDEPSDLESRAGMQLGACLAGLAIENSMLGAAHALANPLTAHYGIVHGQAIGLMLPHVMRFNGEQFDPWFLDLLELAPGLNGHSGSRRCSHELADFVTSLVRKAGLKTHLSACGVERSRLPQLADEAATQWTGRFNPRPVAAPELLALYEAAFEDC